MTEFLMEAANGMLVNVDAKDLEDWEKQQQAVREGRFQPNQAITKELINLMEQYKK